MEPKEASSSAARRAASRKRARHALDSSATSPTITSSTNSSRRKIRRLNKPNNSANSTSGKKASISRVLPRNKFSPHIVASSSSPTSTKTATTKHPKNANRKTKSAAQIESSPSNPSMSIPRITHQSPPGDDNCENFEPMPNTSQATSPLKSPMRAMLRQLQTDLSPKFVSPSPPSSSSVRCSRYGRTQKTKDSTDFLDTHLALAVRRSINDKPSPTKDTESTLPRQSRPAGRTKTSSTKTNEDSVYNVDLIRSPNNERSRYLSPIEKLIEINKFVKVQTDLKGNSPSILGEDYVRTPRAMTTLSPTYSCRQIDFEQSIVPKTHTLDPDPKRDPPIIRLSPALSKKSNNSPRRPHIPPPPLFSESEPTPTLPSKNKSGSPLQLKSPDKQTVGNCFSSFVSMRKIDIAAMLTKHDNTPIKSTDTIVDMCNESPLQTICQTPQIPTSDAIKGQDDSSTKNTKTTLAKCSPDNSSKALCEENSPKTPNMSSTESFKQTSSDEIAIEHASSMLDVIQQTEKTPIKNIQNRSKLSLCKEVSPKSESPLQHSSPNSSEDGLKSTPLKNIQQTKIISPTITTSKSSPIRSKLSLSTKISSSKRQSPELFSNGSDMVIVTTPLDTIKLTSISSINTSPNNRLTSCAVNHQKSPVHKKNTLVNMQTDDMADENVSSLMIDGLFNNNISSCEVAKPKTPKIKNNLKLKNKSFDMKIEGIEALNQKEFDKSEIVLATTTANIKTSNNKLISPRMMTRPRTPQKNNNPTLQEQNLNNFEMETSTPITPIEHVSFPNSVSVRNMDSQKVPNTYSSLASPETLVLQNYESTEVPQTSQKPIFSPNKEYNSQTNANSPVKRQYTSTMLSESSPSTSMMVLKSSPIKNKSRQFSSSKTSSPQPVFDVFKKPSPKSINKRLGSPKSTINTPPQPPPCAIQETSSLPLSETEIYTKNDDVSTSFLASQQNIKTYINRRRLLSVGSSYGDADVDEANTPLQAKEDVTVITVFDEITNTSSIETTLDCLPAEEPTQYNLIDGLVNIKSDPDFGLLSNSPIPDDDIPLQCEVELTTDGLNLLPIETGAIKTEVVVEMASTVAIKSENYDSVPLLDKSFDGDNSPSVSSADSAKGSSIVDDDRSGSSAADGWQVGNLAWARIGNYPYWPCIVCSSPEGTFLSFSAGKKPQQRVHVRFLADNGRRCWATASCMMPFRSIEDFENHKRQLPPNLKAKDPRARAFTVSEANLILWHQAVVEGQLLGTFPTNKRQQVFEKLLNEESISKKPLISIKRHSIASQDSFDSLFTDVDRRITSTPSIISSRRSSVQEIESITSVDMVEPIPVDCLSRSPTPESPMYEELSFNKGHADENDTGNIQNFLLSLSSNTETPSSPVPDQHSDDFHSRLKLDEHIQDMDDDNFRDFYKHTKANFLSESESGNESHLKHLAHKMWMLKQLKVAKKKPSTKRGIPDEAGKPTLEQKQEAKKRKLEAKSPALPMKNASINARRSIRTSISSFKTRKSGDNALDVKPKSEPEVDNADVFAEKAAKRAQRAEEKEKRELLEMSKYFMKKFPKNILFRGLDRELVCRYCHKTENLVKCHTSTCHEHVHHLCATNPAVALEQSKPIKGRKSTKSLNSSVVACHVTGDDDATAEEPTKEIVELPKNMLSLGPAYCPDCAVNGQPVCYVCKTADGTVIRCTDKNCGRQFHVACLRYWPQNKINHQNDASQQLLCPCHVCHTCISDDPRGKHYHTNNSKLTKCVKCPATYHIDSCCIPAGSKLLTASQLICPRHRVENRKPVNANWCFICSSGGELVCCETCPTSFHVECLKVDVSESCYICEECETGRFPLYGEIVWAKIGNCRWWPAVIVPPAEIPDTVLAVKRELHNFAIRFFGSRDYSWISRGFVFLYQEGDSEYTEIGESRPDRVYQKALVEAKEYAAKLKDINEQNINPDKERNLKPLPYTKITRNRPIAPVKLYEQNDEDGDDKVCECTDKDDDPCGPNSVCMNRMLFFECDPAFCRAGDKCQNQRFEKRQYPNMVERRIEGKGWGLLTLETIPAGTFIIEYVGELINQKEFDRRIHEMQKTKDEHYYFLTLTRELIIDAGPRGNSSRFINHSCEPNCETQCWQVKGNTRVGLFALDDIPANTELTFNYNLECIGELKKTCHCGAKRCAGFIGAKYVDPDERPKAAKKEKQKKKSRVQKTLPKIPSTKKSSKKPAPVEKKNVDSSPTNDPSLLTDTKQ